MIQAQIEGHEARGHVAVVSSEDGAAALRLTDLWVAPGAPDVRLYLTADGKIDGATDLGPIATVEGTKDVPVPAGAPVGAGVTVLVHCTVFSVEFGRGVLA